MTPRRDRAASNADALPEKSEVEQSICVKSTALVISPVELLRQVRSDSVIAQSR